MQIFYSKIDDIINSYSQDKLEEFSVGKTFKSENKRLEHLCGLFLTDFCAKNYLNIKKTTIILKNKKPFFKDEDIFFSISHSNDIIAVAFSHHNIGLDIEYMSDRDFDALIKRYKLKSSTENPKTDFYEFWTKYEAEIKLAEKYKDKFSTIFEKDYMLTCVCTEDFPQEPQIKKIEFAR